MICACAHTGRFHKGQRMDGPDGIPVLRLSSYGGKRVDDMTREELVEALNAIWLAYVAVNSRHLGADTTKLPDKAVGAYDEVLREWFYGADP